MRKPKLVFLLSILPFLLFAPAGCNKELSQTRILMGTQVKITVQGKDTAKLEEAINKAFLRMQEIESHLSLFLEDSELSYLNKHAYSKPVIVSEDTFTVVKEALKISKLTGGAFDITVGPLLELWGFKERTFRIPSDEEISTALESVGYRKIIVNEKDRSIRLLKEGITLDLSGIAKGYAVDEACALLKKLGVERALVDAGGDIKALKNPYWRRGWLVAIQHPRKKGDYLGFLSLRDCAITTSGDYENFFIHKGKLYSHIIDPRTGRPTQSGVCSATVIGKSATMCDALSTALLVLKAEEGLKLMEDLPDYEAIIVAVRDGRLKILATEGAQRLISWNPD